MDAIALNSDLLLRRIIPYPERQPSNGKPKGTLGTTFQIKTPGLLEYLLRRSQKITPPTNVPFGTSFSDALISSAIHTAITSAVQGSELWLLSIMEPTMSPGRLLCTHPGYDIGGHQQIITNTPAWAICRPQIRTLGIGRSPQTGQEKVCTHQPVRASYLSCPPRSRLLITSERRRRGPRSGLSRSRQRCRRRWCRRIALIQTVPRDLLLHQPAGAVEAVGPLSTPQPSRSSEVRPTRKTN